MLAHSHEFDSRDRHKCIGMFSQSAGKPEMMLNAVYACHTIADTDTPNVV